MKVAIIHYWLVGMRGGEKVIEELCELYPEADIYTHVLKKENISPTILKHQIYETFISKLPWAKRLYQKYLPLMPMALEGLDLTQYDLVISSEAGPAKGVIISPDTVHICYCHSPMRYIWDQYWIYKSQARLLTRLLMPFIAHYLRAWDTSSAARVDRFIANSHFISNRIKKSWRREATVIHPPVDIDSFRPSTQIKAQDYYLFAGELVSYKRPDLVIDAFNNLGLKLIVIGDGPERNNLQKNSNPNIQFLGKVPFETLRDHFQRCRALVFPGIEDFGIVPVEVMASGRPVIAYAKGGALETVTEGITGKFFEELTVESLASAVSYVEKNHTQFLTTTLINYAEKFAAERFRNEISEFINTEILSSHTPLQSS